MYLGVLIIALITGLLPRSRVLRAATFLGFLFLCAAENSLGKIDHGRTSWIFFLFFLALPRNINEPSFQRALRFTTTVIFSTFIAAGLWKLRSVLEHVFDPGFAANFALILPNHLATKAFTSEVPRFVLPLVLRHPILSSTLWLAAVGLELSFVIPLTLGTHRDRMFRAWILFAILFHLILDSLLGIWFAGQVLLLMLLFVGADAESANP